MSENNHDVPNDELEVEYKEYPAETVPVTKRKKKKRRKKRYLLKFCILLILALGVYLFLTSSVFTINEIEVENNNHYTKEQIVEIAKVKIGDNLFKVSSSEAKAALMEDPYIKTAEVKKKFADTLSIKVSERKEKVFIKHNGEYVICDFDGMVLKTTKKKPTLTEIKKMELVKAVPGKALEVNDDQILADTLNLLKTTEANDLYFIKVVPSDIFVRAYIYENLVCEGTYENIGNNLDYLAKVIKDLHSKKTKRGTIKVSGNGYITYNPEVQ